MKVKTPIKGGVIQSLRGRDKGKIYVVADVQANGIILAVDGRVRTLANPKKKNIKHVYLMPLQLPGEIPQDGAYDNRVAYFLKELKGRADK